MSSQRQFETTNICLGAALLANIPGSLLSRISTAPSIDGKRLLTIAYPPDQEASAQQIVQAFLQRRLVVDLYAYNRCLNRLRDRLHHSEQQPCHSATS